MKQFESFGATHLYCNNCGRSMPVKEILLLILSDGNLYDYRCANCGESLGTRKETRGFPLSVKPGESADGYEEGLGPWSRSEEE